MNWRRRIAGLRKVSRDIVAGIEPPFKITVDNLRDYLNKPRYLDSKMRHRPQLGSRWFGLD